MLNHHARNTVFTCLDFECGARASPAAASSGSFNDGHAENESLKSVYVGSKHGVVFQINYAREELEATYHTNDAAIYCISVNQAFCVTGSEDMFLRTWPLDFSSYHMEAKHQCTVCSVDISPDGLRIIVGAKNGNIGILDKGDSPTYKTIMRTHAGAITDMDYHKELRCIVTVSEDF